MTNFFLEELRKIYGDGRVIHDPQFVNSLANAATAVLAICGSKRGLQKISLQISTHT